MRREQINTLLATVFGLISLLLLGFFAGSSDADSRSGKSPWRGHGMWVWYVKDNPDRLADRLKYLRVDTVFIKSADGGNYWSQFNQDLVQTLHRRGINVCAWQYVYGTRPLAEARVAARAKATGADCFVIDAEAEYEGRHRQAKVYIKELRRLVGRRYQIGFTSFPYVNLHPDMPYKIFLGRGGAQANLPQMYWKEIGESPRQTLYGTWNQNLAFGRHVYPIGQAHDNPRPEDIDYFVRKLRSVDARGISWWSLDHLTPEIAEVIRRQRISAR